jgi:light-independent protochlorophyllide reductase subunit B
VAVAAAAPSDTAAAVSTDAPPTGAPTWTADGEKELKKIPFFVRGKAKRNTERFAVDQGIALITVETLYDAKAHFSR